MKNQFGGKWLVVGCKKDGYCSMAHGDLDSHEYLTFQYGQTYWAVFGFGLKSMDRIMGRSRGFAKGAAKMKDGDIDLFKLSGRSRKGNKTGWLPKVLNFGRDLVCSGL